MSPEGAAPGLSPRDCLPKQASCLCVPRSGSVCPSVCPAVLLSVSHGPAVCVPCSCSLCVSRGPALYAPRTCSVSCGPALCVCPAVLICVCPTRVLLCATVALLCFIHRLAGARAAGRGLPKRCRPRLCSSLLSALEGRPLSQGKRDPPAPQAHPLPHAPCPMPAPCCVL